MIRKNVQFHLLTVLFLSCSVGCIQGNQTNVTGKKVLEKTDGDSEEDSSNEKKLPITPTADNGTKATFMASAQETQLMGGMSGTATSGATLAIAPGSLKQDAVIKLQEGAPLTDPESLEDIGLSAEGSVAGSGTPILVDSSEDIDIANPMTLSLPIPAGLGLTSARKDFVILFRVRKTDGFVATGLIPTSKITFGIEKLSVDITLFGVYQVALLSNSNFASQEILKESNQAIKNKSGIKIRNQKIQEPESKEVDSSSGNVEAPTDTSESPENTASDEEEATGTGDNNTGEEPQTASQPAPDLAGPPGSFSISQTNYAFSGSGSQTVNWGASQNASVYAAGIYANSDCSGVVSEQTDISSTSATFNIATAGSYFVCITAASASSSDTTNANNNGISFIIDNSVGTPTIIGAPSSINNQTSFSLSISGSDITEFQYGVVVGSDCSSAYFGSWISHSSSATVDVGSLVDGTLTVCVKSRDELGNTLNTPVSSSWTKDTTGPAAFTLSYDTLHRVGDSFSFGWTARPAGETLDIKLATDDSCSILSATQSDLTGTTATFTLNTVGKYYVCAYAYDNLGNVTTLTNNNISIVNPWTPISTTNAPDGRNDFSAVWTGSKLIVWGGYRGSITASTSYLNTGAVYDLATNTWTAMSTTNAPSPRAKHTAVWTGSKMIVWGGHLRNSTENYTYDDGAIYDPSTDTWTALPASDPDPVSMHSTLGFWTGETGNTSTKNRMIIFNGYHYLTTTSFAYKDDAGIYNIADDSWTSVSTTNYPSLHTGSSGVWTGSKMIVWGGAYGLNVSNVGPNGGVYDLENDTWAATTTTGAPLPRLKHQSIWTGSDFILWGGQTGSGTYTNTGAKYRLNADTWTAIATPTIDGRIGFVMTYVGGKIFVWGGKNSSFQSNGGIYDPTSDTWHIPTSETGTPSARAFMQGFSISARQVLIWGGNSGGNTTDLHNTGFIYTLP